MKKTILCLGLLASSISHAATVQDELKAVSGDAANLLI